MKYNALFIALILLGCLSIESLAQGDLLISPNRVVFEGRKQKAELNLINTGSETTTFSVSFVQRRMNEDGSFESIEAPDPGQMFASPYLRIYPRQVTLAPGEAQVVMVQWNRKSDMPDGEYRSHLYFRSEKNYAPAGPGPRDTVKALSVQLVPIFGMSIPVIIRAGNVNATATLSDLKLENKDEETYISFAINRTGNKSMYGNLKVEYIPTQGKSYDVGQVKGMAIYTTVNKRYVAVKLKKTPGMGFKNGKFRVLFSSDETAKKQEIYAEATLEL